MMRVLAVNGSPRMGLDAARRAGRELAEGGRMEPASLAEVSRPLVAEEELRRVHNTWV